MAMPRCRSANWSLILTVFAAIALTAFFCLVVSGQKGGDHFYSNPYLAGTITVAVLSCGAAAATGLYAMVRDRERSVSVFITTVLGLLVVGISIAEVALPH